MNPLAITSLAFVSLLAAAQPALAETITVEAAADTFVRRGLDANYGDSVRLRAENHGAYSGTKKMLLSFPAPQRYVGEVQLDLDVISITGGDVATFNVYGINDADVFGEFNEDSFVYADGTFFDDSADGVDTDSSAGDVTRLGTLEVAADGQGAVSFSDSALYWLGRKLDSERLTLLITSPVDDGVRVDFASRENPYYAPPTLSWTFESSVAMGLNNDCAHQLPIAPGPHTWTTVLELEADVLPQPIPATTTVTSIVDSGVRYTLLSMEQSVVLSPSQWFDADQDFGVVCFVSDALQAAGSWTPEDTTLGFSGTWETVDGSTWVEGELTFLAVPLQFSGWL
jgi:hypothetical protein